jgi:hypothetical protein
MFKIYNGGESKSESVERKKGTRVAYVALKTTPYTPIKSIYLKDAEFMDQMDPLAPVEHKESKKRKADAEPADEKSMTLLDKFRAAQQDAQDAKDAEAEEVQFQEDDIAQLLPHSFLQAIPTNDYNKQLLKRAIQLRNPSLLIHALPRTHMDRLRQVYDEALRVEPGLKDNLLTLGHECNVKFIQPVAFGPTFRGAIFGKTGSGKSFFCSSFCRAWRAENPVIKDPKYPEDETKWKNMINFFGYSTDDPVYKGIEGFRNIKLATFMKHPPTAAEFKNSLNVFDDVEGIKVPVGLKQVVSHLRDEMQMTGRKLGISTFSILHKLFGGLESSVTHTEGDFVVVYPTSNPQDVARYLKEKLRLAPDDVQWVMSRKTRWVLIKTSYPSCFITACEIKIY